MANTSNTDSRSDEALLAAISANAETAHVLAAIAAGGNPSELIATLLPQPAAAGPEPEPEAAPAPEATPAPQPEVTAGRRPLYSTPASDPAEEPSFPSFLSAVSPGFWDEA